MRYLSLPQTDLRVSQICLGTAEFGLKTGRDETFRLLDTYVSRGGSFVDTAHCYSDWVDGEQSRSEKVIGQWLSARGNRESIVLATKGGIDFRRAGPPISLSREELEQDIQESLANLQTDHVDIYWLHRDEPARPVGEIMETLNRAVTSARARYIGCSNWATSRIAEANAYARANALQPFIASQVEWSLVRMLVPERPFDPGLPFMDRETYDYHRRTGLTAVAFSAQARGFLPLLAKRGEEGLPDHLRDRCLDDRTRAAFSRLQTLAARTGETIAALALSWISSHTEFTGVPIIFTSKLEHLLESLTGEDTHLTPEQMAYLLGRVGPPLCQGGRT